MKKLFYMIVLLPAVLLAGLNITKINNTLSSIKSVHDLKFYNDNKKIDLKSKLRFTSLPDANVVIFPTKKVKNKMLIVNSYKELLTNKKSIGAIYLKKGRTQIIFIKERLAKNDLELPPSFENNLLSECQINPYCLLK